MEIQIKITIKNVGDWGINWDDEHQKRSQLEEFNFDMKRAIHDKCGIDLSNIETELTLTKNKLDINYESQ